LNSGHVACGEKAMIDFHGVHSELQPIPRYRFGPIEVDPAAGEIYKSGIKVRVPKKPFQILMALLERPGEVVTRESLREQLWSHGTFVEFEHALNGAVNRLRSSLGDDAASPQFIETVPGRGYRLIVPVENTAPGPEVVEMPLPADVRGGSRRLWLGALGASSLFAVGLWIGHRAAPTPALGAVVRFTIAPPPGAVFEPGTGRQSFQLSPDGHFLAFTARGQGVERSVWIRDLAQPESREVPDARGVSSLFWSPDGAYIYYTRNVGGTLRRISLSGGPQDLLTQLPPLLLGAWFYRGEIRSADRENGWAVPIAGGAPRKLPIPQPWPQPLPDGNRLIYIAWDNAKDINQVRLAAPDQPGTTLFEADSRVFLTPSSRDPRKSWMLYMRGGNLVARGFDPRTARLTSDGPYPVAPHVPYFRSAGSVEASLAGGTLVWLDHPDRAQLVWVDRQGREVSSVGGVLGRFNRVRLSADGRLAVMPVFNHDRGKTDLWTAEIASGAARRVSTLPGATDSPVLSPDGRRIVYGRAYGRPPVLAMITLQEGDVPPALPEGVPNGDIQFPTDWSRDGRFILETSMPRTDMSRRPNADVYLVDLARKSELVPLLAGAGGKGEAVFAPDGRSIAFISDDSGRREVYVQPFAAEARRLTGTRRQISRGGAYIVRWPKPGRELFYLGTDYWVYAVTLNGEAKRLFSIPQQTVAMLHPPFGFDVAQGGERFLVPAYRGDRPLSLAVLLNWENLVAPNSGSATTR
jgi:DNA-binding winged helix-turn-helix (wHTH) protein/Tol biopolymer transport system component